jgi:histidine triad (HIT) family protein
MEANMADYQENIFTKIIRKEVPAKIVYESERVLAINDVNPQAPVHVLILPKRNLAAVAAAGQDDQSLLGELLLEAAALAQKLGVAERGYRLVINTGHDGGQTVPHLHVHLLAGRPLGWPPG